MILLFNRHAGLDCLCGKAIQIDLLKHLDENLRLNFSVWLKYTARNLLEKIILGYPTFRNLITTLETLEMAKPAVDLLRHSFIGFLGFVMIFGSQELKSAEFLTAEGVLIVGSENGNFRMSSAFMDELIRRRV